MKPGEVYPKTRKADADRLLADAAAQAAALAEKTARYETLVATADKAFKAKSYKEAKGSYEEAARILPAEKYPQERIALCTAEIEKEAAAAAAADSASASAAAAAAAAAELDAKYTAQISAADAAFATLRERFPDKTEASVLAEPDTSYDSLVQVMDAVRVRQSTDGGKVVRRELFPQIALGDAPT
jgi:hypothetical protein